MKILLSLLTASLSILPSHTQAEGSQQAIKGGGIILAYPSYPQTLNPYIGFEQMSSTINSVILDSLYETNPKTGDKIPLLAKKWKISADKKIFTFYLDPRAKFSDGKPVTAADVKFTFDTVTDKKNKTVAYQGILASIKDCQIIDKHTVKFTAQTIHFQNFEKVGGLGILPKHFYSKGDFNKSFNRKALGSGPYILHKAVRDNRVVLKRNPHYWAKDLPQNIGRYNFDLLTYKVIADDNVRYEAFKKGDVDYFFFQRAKRWATETSGKRYKKNYIKKIFAKTNIPGGLQGFVWNSRDPLFKDVKVRKALAHLMDRRRWIKTQFYNQYTVSTGIIATNSPYHDPTLRPVEYSPKKSKELLLKAGWKEQNGKLIKDGKPFEFELLVSGQPHQFFTLYQEDLDDLGIKMNIKTVDWTNYLKLGKDFKFQATFSARGQGIHPSNFDVLWGSKMADTKGGSNWSGYKNPEVDTLAPIIDQTFDEGKRKKLVQKMDGIISRDHPMAFTWEANFFRVAYWNKFQFTGKGYFQYSYWSDCFHYWWYDPSKDKKLQKAKKRGLAFVSDTHD